MTKLNIIPALVLLGCCLGVKKYKLQLLDRTRYLPLEEVEEFLFKMKETAPDILQLKKIGDTRMEGKSWHNDIHAAVIGNDSAPIMLFDCGIHSREWISPASCLYVIEKLVRVFDYTKNGGQLKTSLTNYQWHIIPVLNPDGYNITHTSFRMHRKNGRPMNTLKLNAVSMPPYCQRECKRNPHHCVGVDLNRNFPAGYGKGHKSFEIHSKQVCRQVYRGDHYLSEPETIALNSYVRSIRSRIVAAISIHSFGKIIDHPNGWMKSADPNQADPKDVERVQNFIRGFNKYLNYDFGFVEDVFGGEEYLAGGASEDFYYNYHDIKIAMTIELDPGLNDSAGFKLPEKYIKPVGKKFWYAVQGMAMKMDQMQEELMRLNSKHSFRQSSGAKYLVRT